MKMSLDWHQQCYINNKKFLRDELEKIIRDLDRLQQEAERLGFYETQIKEAQRLCLDGFDRDKFMVARKKDTSP